MSPIMSPVNEKTLASHNLQGVIFKVVVLPGLEPGISGPESDVLPLHHRTVFVASSSMFLDYGCKDTDIFYSCKYFAKKFHQNKQFSFSPVLNLLGLYIY